MFQNLFALIVVICIIYQNKKENTIPTGYTADIAKDISFREYAISCMKNFGATIVMRDAPIDASITKENISCDISYYENGLKTALSYKEMSVSYIISSLEEQDPGITKYIISNVIQYYNGKCDPRRIIDNITNFAKKDNG